MSNRHTHSVDRFLEADVLGDADGGCEGWHADGKETLSEPTRRQGWPRRVTQDTTNRNPSFGDAIASVVAMQHHSSAGVASQNALHGVRRRLAYLRTGGARSPRTNGRSGRRISRSAH